MVSRKIPVGVAQEFGKPNARAVHATFHGADSTFANRCRNLIGQAFCRDEEKCLPLVSTQALQGSLKVLKVQFVCLNGCGRQSGGMAPVAIPNLSCTLSMLREEGVAQDREKPRVQVRAGLEPASLVPTPHQRLLDQVVGTVGVMREGNGEGPQVRDSPYQVPSEFQFNARFARFQSKFEQPQRGTKLLRQRRRRGGFKV
jgi:hypothetical protein